MKIKAKEYYFVSTTSSTMLHLSNQDMASRSVCGGIANIDIVDFYNEADKSKVCKNCLKHTDAWEPVEEQHDPNKFKVGDTVEVVKIVESCSGGWIDDWTPTMDQFVGEKLVVSQVCSYGYKLRHDDLGPFDFPSHALKLVKAVESQPSSLYVDRKQLENAEAELERLGTFFEVEKENHRQKIRAYGSLKKKCEQQGSRRKIPKDEGRAGLLGREDREIKGGFWSHL